MASITSEPNGRKRIQFVAPDGSRKTIRLGKVTLRQAESFRVRIEDLVGAASGAGVIQEETARWLGDLDATMHDRIARAGLTQSRDRSTATLGAFLDEYFKHLTVKDGTETAYAHTKRCLIEFFGESRGLRTIGPVEAEKFRQWLKASASQMPSRRPDVEPEAKEAARGLSDATVSRRVGVARMFFHKARKWKLVSENPFSDVKAGNQKNKARQAFVGRDVAQKVLDDCPDAQWRLLFALSRYGGLRCPSEHLALKWQDVDWARSRLRVTASKTEHHEGGGERWIPIFPELYPYLREVYEAAEEGTTYVITKHRDQNANLRTQLMRIIRRAGLNPWPKLFQNLRSTRQTELAATHPIHVVCAWLGNTKDVAQDHYLQVTDADFERASIQSEQKAAQNAAHSAHGSTTQESSGLITKAGNRAKNAVLAGNQSNLMGAAGPEHPSKTPEKPHIPSEGGAFSGARAARYYHFSGRWKARATRATRGAVRQSDRERVRGLLAIAGS